MRHAVRAPSALPPSLREGRLLARDPRQLCWPLEHAMRGRRPASPHRLRSGWPVSLRGWRLASASCVFRWSVKLREGPRRSCVGIGPPACTPLRLPRKPLRFGEPVRRAEPLTTHRITPGRQALLHGARVVLRHATARPCQPNHALPRMSRALEAPHVRTSGHQRVAVDHSHARSFHGWCNLWPEMSCNRMP